MAFSCERDTVRTFVTLLLTGFLLACPLVCGAAEAGHVTHHVNPASSPAESPAPGHCPADTDNCICQGAVQSADSRVTDLDAIGLPLPFHGLVGILDHTPAHWLAHLTSDGRPTGLASWGDANTIRAVLQNFRC